MTGQPYGGWQPTPDEPPEHHRSNHHLDDLAQIPPEHEADLIATVLRDPDPGMADSAVLRHLDHRASQLLRSPAYTTWTDTIAPALADRPILTRRLREWTLPVTSGRCPRRRVPTRSSMPGSRAACARARRPR